MKIAVIGAKGLPPKQGGIEHYCAQVYPRMVAQGHSVDLFARCSYTNSAWGWGKNYDFQGVRVIPLPGLSLRGVDAFVTSALGAVAACGQRYDIIHFHALGPALFSWVPRIASGAKVVVICHGLDWQRSKWGTFASRLIHLGEKTAVQFADDMIVVSEELRSYFHRTYGRETVYIPTAAATYAKSDPDFTYGEKLGLQPGRYILFLGRLVPEKRPDLLLDAFCALKPEGWKLVLAGGVDTQQFISQMLAKVADNPNVVFAGELWGARLAEIVRGAGLFVLPSDVEGLPLAMLEAMHEGIPVMGSNIPPHQQLLGKDRGVLFRAGDIDSCILSLNWALNHRQEMGEMAKRAQDYVQLNYSWERIVADNLNLYTRLLDQPNPLRRLQSSASSLAEVCSRE